ncbi:DNA-binding transcription factor yap1 [Rhizina undulata]
MTAAAPDNLYLSPDQQDLLLAALTSNSSSSPLFNTPPLSHHLSQAVSQQAIPNAQSHGTPDSMVSPLGNEGSPPSASLNGSFAGGTPLISGELDYDWDHDIDGNWDYDLGGALLNGPDGVDLGAYAPTPSSNANGTPNAGEHEKRKLPPSAETEDGSPSADPHDAEPKRREAEDKTAKKPGRKPLTSEPTSKRKAQNRAAQRAFRERKEKHLKDLEQKVADLEKASESANHENSVLRAQVDRLQTELKEYKRRLHVTSQSRGSTAFGAGLFGNRNGNAGNFQFEFPMFGAGTGIFNRQNSLDAGKNGIKIGPGTLMERMNAGANAAAIASISPVSNGRKSPNMNGASTTNGSSNNTGSSKNNKDSSATSNQGTPKLNGNREFVSSPSASSVSQNGPGSSCGTSPEPMNTSPASANLQDPANCRQEDKSTPKTTSNGGTYVCKSGTLDGETETTFCEKLGMACGNPNNPIPKAAQLNAGPGNIPTSLGWFADRDGGNFDPVLFNDYRDPVNDTNNGINMSFFEDAFPGLTTPYDLSSITAPQQNSNKKGLLAEIDQLNKDDDDEDDEDLVVPGDPKQMLSCNKIWDCISAHPRFVSGELDMDGLCSELRSKAKCSETGVVVAETDVQEVLKKVGVSHKDIL